MSVRTRFRSIACWLPGLLAASAIVFSVPAWAESYAFVSTAVNLRAGPRLGYPTLHVLRPGLRVEVHGCLDDYSWCDVSALDYRGWVYANYLDYNNGNRRVTIANYGPQIGITVVAFGLLNYWSQHYRQRPWYSERNTYEARFGLHGDRGREHRPRRNVTNHPSSTRRQRPGQTQPQRQQRRQRTPGEQHQQRPASQHRALPQQRQTGQAQRPAQQQRRRTPAGNSRNRDDQHKSGQGRRDGNN